MPSTPRARSTRPATRPRDTPPTRRTRTDRRRPRRHRPPRHPSRPGPDHPGAPPPRPPGPAPSKPPAARKEPSTIAPQQRPAGSPRRSEAARLAVLNAADDLLVEHGFEGLTIEGIAAAAGVAKQTIYRWWKSKVDILFDNLVLDAESGLAWPDEPTGPDALRGYVHRHAAFLGEAPAGRVLQALIGHAQLDARTAELLHTGFLDGLRTRDTRLAADCLGTGPDAAAVLLDALMAPLYHRALVLRRPLDRAFVDTLLDRHLAD
ncbi:TetR/AcrR family transcriptional regulator [Kitasatospora sp. NPDC054939]